MKNSKVLKTILVVSGLVVAGAGGSILFSPVAFYAANGIDLGGQVSLLNEVRAAGGALLLGGVLIFAGAFVAQLTFTAAVVSPLVYLSYGMSRVLSIGVDGLPADGLLTAAVVELGLGLMGVFALLKYRTHA